jgi:hypothetical protein
MKYMMEYFIPEDNESSDSAHQNFIRDLTVEPLDTLNDEEFTKEEIQAMLEKFDPGTAPGEDGLNRYIHLKIFKSLSTFFTEIYNECLRKEYFPR